MKATINHPSFYIGNTKYYSSGDKFFKYTESRVQITKEEFINSRTQAVIDKF